MSVYILVFFLSILCLYYAESKHFKGLSARVGVIIALLLPCVLAALRADTIGTDIMVYAKPLYTAVQDSRSFSQFFSYSVLNADMWSYFTVEEFEFGFLALVFLAERIFHSFSILLFFVQLLIVLPIYKGLRYFNSKVQVWFGMMVFYLMFYNQSYNMMRQWIAVAFMFYAFRFLVEKQYKKYIVVIAIAALFHYSAVIGLVNLVVYHLVAGGRALSRTVTTLLLVVVGAAAIVGVDFFAGILKLLGLRYSHYVDGDISFLPNQILYRLPIVLLIVVRWKYLKKHDNLTNYYLVMTFYDFLCSQLASIFEQSGRIGAYFSVFYLLAYPAVCSASKYKDNRKIMGFAVFCFLCIYWWFIYVYRGSSQTIPYISIFS